MSDIPDSESVVIFTRFRMDADDIRTALAGERRCATLDGAHADELPLFESGEANPLICNIQSGKEGIDLTKARYAIYYFCRRQPRRLQAKPVQDQAPGTESVP